MRLLLDTHIALWAVSDPRRLDKRVQSWISDPEHVVAVSIATLWEIAIKRSLGRKHDTPQLSATEAIKEFVAADFNLLAVSIAQIEIVETLPFHNRDPFDRLLVATARANNYSFLTRDKALTAYGDFVIVV